MSSLVAWQGRIAASQHKACLQMSLGFCEDIISHALHAVATENSCKDNAFNDAADHIQSDGWSWPDDGAACLRNKWIRRAYCWSAWNGYYK